MGNIDEWYYTNCELDVGGRERSQVEGIIALTKLRILHSNVLSGFLKINLRVHRGSSRVVQNYPSKVICKTGATANEKIAKWYIKIKITDT